jgi:hypothetical protein
VVDAPEQLCHQLAPARALPVEQAIAFGVVRQLEDLVVAGIVGGEHVGSH